MIDIKTLNEFAGTSAENFDHSKALERTLEEELGKLTPKLS